MPEINAIGGFVPLGYDFLLNKMPQANGTYVKIYLYILAKAGGRVEYSEIASALLVLESDVVNAVEYWKKEGVLSEEGGVLSIGGALTDAGSRGDAPEPARVQEAETVQGVKKGDYTREQVNAAINSTPALRDMISMAEELLEKPLNVNEMDTLYWFYDGLGFSPEAVLMLLEYCVSRGKARLSYAEKVALSWKERGLTTPEDISRCLRDAERRMDAQKQVMTAMGIGSRAASDGEEKYFNKWFDDYGMSTEMILLAHEYCLTQTNKLSFPYMDKIMERWNAEGIHTTSAAQEEHEKFRSRSKKPEAAVDYDYSDLEQILRGK